MNQKDYSTLLKLGLSEKEASIYFNLIQFGVASIAELSKITQMPRTTLRENINRLNEKGLVKNVVQGKKKLLKAETPEKLTLLLKEQQLRIEDKRTELSIVSKDINRLIGNLLNIQPLTNLPETEVQYFDNIESIRRLYDRIVEAMEIKAYVDVVGITKYFPENFKKYREALKREGTVFWDIIYLSDGAKELQKMVTHAGSYHYKFFPPEVKINQMDYLIYEDNISLIQAGKSFFAVNIRNKLLADNARSMFDLVWSFLPELI